MQEREDIGLKRGLEIGEMKKAEDIACNLIRMGFAPNKIEEATNLSIERIEQLTSSIKNN